MKLTPLSAPPLTFPAASLIFPLLILHIISPTDNNISPSLLPSVLHTQTTPCSRVTGNKEAVCLNALLFPAVSGSGTGWQQIVCVQWIAAQESINWGLCKWTEQGCNQVQSPAKSCLLTHLLKHAGKLTARDFNGMNLKWWRWNTVKKHGGG